MAKKKGLSVDELEHLFEKHEGDHLKWKDVKNKLSKKPHMHAFIVLDTLIPGPGPLIVAGYREELTLNFDLDMLSTTSITEEQIHDLIRCGVFLEGDTLNLFI